MNPKMKAAFQLASVISAAFGLKASYKSARENNDKLELADVLITTLSLITSTALAVRALRKGSDDE
ncbi:hypothetical protein EIL87_14770 [Saccharopolyspora rhizosphaerae]|uniref:Uncharacterized protein n=1 Tax=Saccharopolyspora rhizosphaerae TaxID=2492662 RepID=A0A3R8P4F6_9PSEU|nr:hypothetical protein [Saccharopolyspora rhizosphaerae]RRO16293.1 hypothetical protein EIL87_14770 [Saccharopolyspora rhizosphaerae]